MRRGVRNPRGPNQNILGKWKLPGISMSKGWMQRNSVSESRGKLMRFTVVGFVTVFMGFLAIWILLNSLPIRASRIQQVDDS